MVIVIQFIKKFHTVTEKLLTGLAAILLITMVAVVMIQVVARYIFVVATPWTEEGSRILMIWICFIGSAAVMIRGDHLMVDVLYHRFRPKTRRYIRIIFDLATLIVAALLFRYAITLLSNPMIWNGSTTVMHLPLFYYYGGLPISMGIVILFELLDLIDGLFCIIHKIDMIKPAEEE